ncbi:MAG TPA: hypothetical protein VEC19_03215 [Usitatibacter sp.]|nr:hypothetical protein [Usitatibacter sp.]
MTDRTMTRAILVALGTGVAISSAAALGIAASTADEAPSPSERQYRAALRVLETGRNEAVTLCDSAPASERELCRAEAAAREMVRMAEIENDFRRTQQAARALQRARIDARYQVERVRCNSLGGFKRDKCLVQVHASRGRAMLHAAAPYEVRFTP